MKPATGVTVVFLALIALLHVFRLMFGVEVTVDATVVPVWVSIFGVLGPGALALWLWREQIVT